MLNLPVSPQDYEIYVRKMNNAFVDTGLYLRSKHHKEKSVSQDEQTGFAVASFVLGTHHRFAIWKYLETNWGNYPAAGKNKFYNGGAYYSWALLSDSSLSPLLAPWYTINLLISSNKPKGDTSSKLIYTTELFICRRKSWYANILWKYFQWRMEKMYGTKWIRELYMIYFGREDNDHPLLQLTKEIQCQGSY